LKPKEARIRAGFGTMKVARLTGVDRPGLYRIEAGLRVPRIETATSIARVLDLDVRDIDEFGPAVSKAEAAGLTVSEETCKAEVSNNADDGDPDATREM
jgi:DNA-binding XRE family transcriptional regulator